MKRRPHLFRPSGWLDWLFLAGIAAKGIDGVLELIGGAITVFLTPDMISDFVERLTRGELSEDPHDVIANYLLHTAHGLTGSGLTFGATYLFVHGAVKIVLVTALVLNKMWAYPWMIAVLIVFICYQIYRIALAPTVGLSLLTAMDIAVVCLTWTEFRRQRRARAAG